MLLTNSLRSGYGFLKGLELVAKEMGDPISKELNRMLREVNLGTTVDDALLNLGRRVNSQDLDIVIGAYLVQKDVGGNLTEIMEKVAETIRERLRIQGDVRVLTTQGKLSGFIVGFMPVAVFLILIMSAPDYFSTMFGPPILFHFMGKDVAMGVAMMAAAVGWQFIGFYMIYKIVSVKVCHVYLHHRQFCNRTRGDGSTDLTNLSLASASNKSSLTHNGGRGARNRLFSAPCCCRLRLRCESFVGTFTGDGRRTHKKLAKLDCSRA